MHQVTLFISDKKKHFVIFYEIDAGGLLFHNCIVSLRLMNTEEKCKNCGRTLEIRSTKPTAAQRKKPFYYSAYYYCPNCRKLYHDEKFKVTNSQTVPLHLGSLETNTG